MVVIEMKCWKCGTEFNVYPEASYPRCPYCDKVNIVGECPNYVELNVDIRLKV